MNPMDVFWLIWMLILPLLGIVTPIIAFVFWFFIVPKIARKLAWDRFRSVSYHMVADSAGWVYLCSTKVELAEGAVKTKKGGWRLLPRALWKPLGKLTGKKKKNNPGPTAIEQEEAEKIILQKFMWKDMNKPMWFSYAGKVPLVNPTTLAALEQTEKTFSPDALFEDIQTFVKDLPTHFRRPLTEKLKQLHTALKAKKLTFLDPRIIKQVLSQMYTKSQIDAIETYSEMVGREEAGKQYTPLILGLGFFAVLIVAIIVIAMFLN